MLARAGEIVCERMAAGQKNWISVPRAVELSQAECALLFEALGPLAAVTDRDFGWALSGDDLP